jgi:hypothetical protein
VRSKYVGKSPTHNNLGEETEEERGQGRKRRRKKRAEKKYCLYRTKVTTSRELGEPICPRPAVLRAHGIWRRAHDFSDARNEKEERTEKR